jgi:hypothetical protein
LAATLLTSLLLSGRGEGTPLNLGGSLDLSYGKLRSNQEGAVVETSAFQQRYNVRSFGDLIDPRIGGYTAGFTFMKEDVSSNTSADDRNFKLEDYSLAVNLFPRLSPLSLYAQQVVSDNSSGVVSKNRLTTYGANWSLSVPRFPRFALSLNRSELKSDDRLRLPDTVSTFVNADTNFQTGNTNWMTRYQFNQTDVARGNGSADSFNSHAVNLNTTSQLTPRLVLSTFSRYATQGGSSATGLSFFPERGIGASLFWNPSTLWDTNLRYEISEIPDTVRFKRQLGFANVNIHPNQRTDLLASVRYFTFSTGPVTTDAPFFDLNLSWRPFFGLTTGVGTSFGYSHTTGGAAEIESYFQRYRLYSNYSKTLTLIRYNASYSASYGVNRVRQGAAGNPQDVGEDLMNTLSLGVENTRIRIVHVAGSVTLNDIERSVNAYTLTEPNQDQRSLVYQLSADSNYFRDLWMKGDSLQLVGMTSFTQISGFGAAGSSWVADGRATYYIRAVMASVNYTHQDFPDGFYTDSDRISEEVQWTASWTFVTLLVNLRDSHQWGQGDSLLTRDVREGTVNLSGQIGQLFAGLDYRVSNDSAAGVRFLNQSLFLRVSRPF